MPQDASDDGGADKFADAKYHGHDLGCGSHDLCILFGEVVAAGIVQER